MTADELADLMLPPLAELPGLMSEADELVAIMVASKETARGQWPAHSSLEILNS